MFVRNTLFVGGVLLVCSLVHCRHHYPDGGGRHHSNEHARRAADGRVQRSASQPTLLEQDPGDDQQTSEDRNPQNPSGFPGEDVLDGLRRQQGRNGVDPEELQEVIKELTEESEDGNDQREQSPDVPSHPRSRHHNGGSQNRRRHPTDQVLDDRQSIEEQRDVGDEGLSQTGPMEGELGSERQETPAIEIYELKSEDEEDKSVEQPSSESESGGPSYEGYEEYEGVGIYKFHLEGADGFDEANEICKMEGGHLAIANSKDEADVFVTLWVRHGPADESDAYVGIHNRNPDNVFRTVLGNTLPSTGYLAWRAGEPNNKNGVEHCVSFFRYGGYRDIPCNGPRPFICELSWKDEN